MKKMIALLTLVTFLCSTAAVCSLPVRAMEAAGMDDYNQQIAEEKETTPDFEAYNERYSDGLYEFYLYDDFACLSGCKDRTITEAIIPAEVKGLPVIGITNNVFGFCRSLKTIVLPDTVQYFEWQDLVVPSVRLGSSDTNPMPSVAEIVVSETNPYYTVSDGLLYTKDMKTLVGCPPALGLTEVRISEQTETIGDYAFTVCYALETAVIPEQIQHICNGAFAGCTGLTKAELPESITLIAGDTFWICESLSEVTFKGKIEKIGYGAFGRCTALTDFTLPETVTFIGCSAFQESGCIENVNGVHYLGNWVVGSDEDVTRAVIPEGTVGISEMAFLFRKELTLLDVPSSVRTPAVLMAGGSESKLSVVHYRAGKIAEKTLAIAKNTTDFYIYDPDCEIFDSEKTIPAQYAYNIQVWDNDAFQVPGSDTEYGILTTETMNGNTVIHGYAGSTAQAYAEKYGRTFVPIPELPGDVSGDGIFSVTDAVQLQKYLLDASTPLAEWAAADLSADGRLDAFDLCVMKRMLLNGSAE